MSASSPIFITGTGRSGTTLLREILNSHPLIYISNEADYYIRSFKIISSLLPRVWLSYYKNTYSYKFQKFSYVEEIYILKKNNSIKNLKDLFAFLMLVNSSRRGAIIVGDKTPGACPKINRMLVDFPDAKIIHMVRCPVDTVQSLNRMPWAASTTLVNALYIRAQYRHANKNKDRILQIRLEDLVDNPEVEVNKVSSFIEINSLCVAAVSENDLPPYPWLKDTCLPIKKNAHHVSVSNEEIILIYLINRKFFEIYGYSVPEYSNVDIMKVLFYVIKTIPHAFCDFINIFKSLYRGVFIKNTDDHVWIDSRASLKMDIPDINSINQWANER